MPYIEWHKLPAGARQHLLERREDRQISTAQLLELRAWIASNPKVPEGEWFKDFGSFKLCGRGAVPTTFLTSSQVARGVEV